MPSMASFMILMVVMLAGLLAITFTVSRIAPGDPARLAGPFPNDEPDPEASGLYIYLNTSKRGITPAALFIAHFTSVQIRIDDSLYPARPVHTGRINFHPVLRCVRPHK